MSVARSAATCPFSGTKAYGRAELRHTVAPPLKLTRHEHLDEVRISWLPAIAGAAVVGTVIRAVFFTPLEAKQGATQKIFYIHVPAAWVASNGEK